MQHPSVDAILANLQPIRERYGEAAFARAAEMAAREVLRTKDTATIEILREALKGVVDFEKVQKDLDLGSPSAHDMTMKQILAQQLRQQLPAITQAQFDIFMAGFDALRAYMGHTFSGEQEHAAMARDALIKSLDVAVTATELSEKLGQVPEAATSPEAAKYKEAPKEFGEEVLQRTLLGELRACQGREEAKSWYDLNRKRFEGVTDPKYRNELFDAVRAALV